MSSSIRRPATPQSGAPRAKEPGELPELRASLGYTASRATSSPEARAQHMDQAARVLALQGAHVTLNEGRVVVMPEEGHSHPLNRLAFYLKSHQDAELCYELGKAGLSTETQQRGAHLNLTLDEVRSGEHGANIQSSLRRATTTRKAARGERSLWAGQLAFNAAKAAPDQKSHEMAFGAVRTTAALLAARAAVVRREAHQGPGLTRAGWHAAAELRDTVNALAPLLTSLEESVQHAATHFDTSSSKVSALAKEEGTHVLVAVAGHQYRANPGEVPLTREHLRSAASEALQTLAALAPRLREQVGALQQIQDPAELATRVADLTREIARADQAYTHGVQLESTPRPLSAPVWQGPGTAPAVRSGQTELEALAASFDYTVGALSKEGGAEAVLAQAQLLLQAHGVAFERVGDDLVILPGSQSLLNEQAAVLHPDGIGLRYQPGQLAKRGANGFFGPSPEGSGYTRHVSISHRSVRELRWDSTCAHEVEHAKQHVRSVQGEAGLWSGQVESLEDKDLVPSRPSPYGYTKGYAVHEILGHVVSARSLLGEAEALLQSEGPSSERAYELASQGVAYLTRIITLADRTVLLAREVAPQVATLDPVVSSVGDVGAVATLSTDRVKFTRVLGEVGGSLRSLREAFQKDLTGLERGAENVAQRTRLIADMPDIPTMARATEALLEQMYEQQDSSTPSV